MWADVWKRWFEICCWWLPTSKGEQTSGSAAKPAPTVTDDVSTDVRGTRDDSGVGSDENDTDDLTVIKGIGPSIQTKLSGFGITSLAALAASDPEMLAVKLKASQPISATRVKGWIEEAQDRVAGWS